MSNLVLVRHGESTFNAEGIWTGWENPPLSENGIQEARKAGELLNDIKFDIAYASDLLRSTQTLSEIKKILGAEIPTVITEAFRERNYGDFTGKNKWEIKKQLGEVEFKKIHRGWDDPVSGGETLKDVYDRAVPYFEKEVLPMLKQGQNVLISSHGNTIRALTKYLENISDSGIEDVEIPTGQVIVYQIDSEGKVVSKAIRKA
jgi:2,3-bisphosphoglycerate-dependent phosphoglycerate mutase